MFKNLSKFAPLAALVAVVSFFALQPSPDAGAAEKRAQVFTKTVDLASQADAVGSTTTIVANGAALGDVCVASFAVDIVDMTVSCYVQAANAIEVRVQNESGSTADLASTTMRVMLFKVPQF